MAPPATPPTTAPMAAPSHPPAIAPTPAPTAAPAPAPIAVFLPGVAHPPRTTTADMTNRKLRIRISSAASVTGALGSSDRQLLGALVPDLDAVAVFEDDQRSPPGADSHLGLRVDLERAGDEPVGRVAVPRPANPQLVLRNHGDRDGQTVRPDDDHADRGAELDTPAAETVALHRNLTEHQPCLPATGSKPGVWTGAMQRSCPPDAECQDVTQRPGAGSGSA